MPNHEAEHASEPESVEQTRDKAASAPEPDDARKPDSPPDLHKTSWTYAFKRSLSEFSKDHVTDLAASLTYFAVLSMFPMLLALVSLLGVFGQGEQSAQGIRTLIDQYAPEELAGLLGDTVSGLAEQTGAGLALVTGLVLALWAASGYVGAFSRAMNRIYEVEEGRPFWKHKPQMLLLTLVLVVILAVIVFAMVLSGDLAQSVGDLIGLGDTAVLVWNIAKWPVIVALAVLVIAMLYYFTPNVKQPRFRWISIGAVLALVVAAVAVVAFSIYVSNFASYNATYGIIGSFIVLLLGLWIVNNVLLFGAEVDAEIERGRQLQGGIEAEETIKLPPRDTRASEKLADRHTKLVTRGRELRLENERSTDR
ncbi:YihY/virulence factor BrkB family protein [Tessaracoccus lubricantis]|uniref:YihY/virulence factor BrkB family protein n=1 Tax=Tessaracoccus lubricantis TaxID=545543 RepID=A0ABP9FM80_9ACTN